MLWLNLDQTTLNSQCVDKHQYTRQSAAQDQMDAAGRHAGNTRVMQQQQLLAIHKLVLVLEQCIWQCVWQCEVQSTLLLAWSRGVQP